MTSRNMKSTDILIECTIPAKLKEIESAKTLFRERRCRCIGTCGVCTLAKDCISMKEAELTKLLRDLVVAAKSEVNVSSDWMQR